jgi:16S rRNA (cytosine967-C5)-methyltransferase
MVRELAWQILRSGAPAPLRRVDREADRAELDPRDRGLLRQLVGTELRRRGSLRAIVRAFTRRPPKPEIATHLHLGLVQLLFLDRIPDHAAVSTTVEAVARTISQSKTTFTNGFLRNVIRARREGTSDDPRCNLVGRDMHLSEPVFRDPETHPLLWAEDAFSMPAPLLKRWIKRYDKERAFALARTFLVEPPVSVRVVRGTTEEARAALDAAECEPKSAPHPAILLCPATAVGAVTSSAAFREGRITVQGEAALRAAELVGAVAGEDILDLCAAPGGKTAVLAATGARVTASDRDPRKLERLEENLQRLGLKANVRTVVGDGTAAIEGTFDAVLIDAPCSNTGTLGARAAARWRFGPGTTRSLVELQGRLLREGAARVRAGGRLVWSTCSLEPEENGQLVRDFLEEQPGWTEEERVESVPDATNGPSDGGIAVRLVAPR